MVSLAQAGGPGIVTHVISIAVPLVAAALAFYFSITLWKRKLRYDNAIKYSDQLKLTIASLEAVRIDADLAEELVNEPRVPVELKPEQARALEIRAVLDQPLWDHEVRLIQSMIAGQSRRFWLVRASIQPDSPLSYLHRNGPDAKYFASKSFACMMSSKAKHDLSSWINEIGLAWDRKLIDPKHFDLLADVLPALAGVDREKYFGPLISPEGHAYLRACRNHFARQWTFHGASNSGSIMVDT